MNPVSSFVVFEHRLLAHVASIFEQGITAAKTWDKSFLGGFFGFTKVEIVYVITH